MGRHKGGSNRKWTKEEKLRIVRRNIFDHVGQWTLAKEEGISRGMLGNWVSAFNQEGEDGLNPKPHRRGNPFAVLHTSKSLSELDRLRLENAKQKVEIERLKNEYSVSFLYKIMNVNRSGYCKWLLRKDQPNRYESDRKLLTELLMEQHEKHKSYGYHRLAALIRNQTGWIFSDNLAHKCCKDARITSKAINYRYRKQGEEHILFPNLVAGKWNARKPMELVASDMTCLKHRGRLYEWTYFLDTFDNEIIASFISSKQNDSRPYYKCLAQFLKKIEERSAPVILHTDQGSIYSSKAFLNAHKDYTIIRSMSRAGTPTDNPVIEAINGWIKGEIRTDFNIDAADDINIFLKDFIFYFNNMRPAAALKYKTPIQYKSELGFG